MFHAFSSDQFHGGVTMIDMYQKWNETLTQNLQNGTMITGGGSGSSAPPYVISPFDAIQRRLIDDGGIVRWDFASVNPTVYANAEACLVFINGKPSGRRLKALAS